MKHVVVDVETHDWQAHHSGVYMTRETCIGRIVEMAWIAYDAQGGVLERKNYLLRPQGYEVISPKARRVHKISTRCVREKGCDAHLVFADFVQLLRQIPEDGFIIAHNMHHEDSIMGNNLSLVEGALQVWNGVPKSCTRAPCLLQFLPNATRYVNRTCGMKLVDLHRIALQGQDAHLHDMAHGALADVQMTWGVFQYFERCIAARGLEVSSTLAWSYSRRRRWNGLNTFVPPETTRELSPRLSPGIYPRHTM